MKQEERVQNEKLGRAFNGIAWFFYAVRFIAVVTVIAGVVLYFLKKPLWIAPVIGVVLYLFYRVIIVGLIFGFIDKVARSQVKEPPACDFDPQKQVPVVRASICNGERVAGFKDKQSGHFTDVMLIRTDADLETFKRMCGVDEVEVEY